MEEYKIAVRSLDGTKFYIFSSFEERMKFIKQLPRNVSYTTSDEPLSVDDQVLQDKLDLEYEIHLNKIKGK